MSSSSDLEKVENRGEDEVERSAAAVDEWIFSEEEEWIGGTIWVAERRSSDAGRTCDDPAVVWSP